VSSLLPWQLVYQSTLPGGLTTCQMDGDYSLPVLQKLIEVFDLFVLALFYYNIVCQHHLEPAKHSSESNDLVSATRHAAKPCVNYLGLILKDLGVAYLACGQVNGADTGHPCSMCVMDSKLTQT